MDKLLAMFVAAQLAQASSGDKTPLPDSADGKLTDAHKARNLVVWETFRVFYHGVIKALASDDPATGWPKPQGGLDLASLVNPGTLAGIAKTLLPALSVPLTSVAANLPNPGG